MSGRGPLGDAPKTNRWTGRPCGARGCAHKAKSTETWCAATAIEGTDGCRRHGGKSLVQARAEGQVRVEAARWGLSGRTVDPAMAMLQLVAQSADRCELYSRVLGEAYEAAEALRSAHMAEDLIEKGAGSEADDETGVESAEVQAARLHLRRVFSTGGVGALVGYTLAATKDGDIYASAEAIRGLVKLEADERDRLANFCQKAIAAGLAERVVRMAEQVGTQMLAVLRAVVGDLDLTPEQMERAQQVIPARIRELTQGRGLKAVG